jgi:hypothetical protein
MESEQARAKLSAVAARRLAEQLKQDAARWGLKLRVQLRAHRASQKC